MPGSELNTGLEGTGCIAFQRGWTGDNDYDDAFDGMLLFFTPQLIPQRRMKVMINTVNL